MNQELKRFLKEEGLSFATLDRRDFLEFLASGITVFFAVGEPLLLAQRRSGSEYPDDFNAYLRVGQDGRVTCYTGKIEMGQGIITSLAQMLAEELEVSLDVVDMVMGDTALCPADMGTFGSRSTKYFGPALRRAAAEARVVLTQLASEKLGIPARQLAAREGVFFDTANPSIRVAYAELARGVRIERYAEGEVSTERHSEHSISGKPTRRTDSLEKVQGKALFAGDIRLSGTLYAKILRPPAHGAKLKNVDTSAARQIEGIRVIEEGDLVAVLHELPDKAGAALEVIEAEFDTLENPIDNSTIFANLLRASSESETVAEKGSLDEGRKHSTKNFEASYYNHYVAHAPIEPHTALANVEGDRVTVWASTQTPFRARDEVASVLELPSENVRVITPFVGGGFGGKTRNQQVIEAVRLSRLAGAPVQVAWSRREEFFFDSFRPAAVIKVQSGLDENNRIVHWDFEIYFAGTRSSEPVYDIPHHRVAARGGWSGSGQIHPFGVGAWRGPGSNTNVFAIESQIDVMAESAGIDPLSFRLMNLSDERMSRVLETVAERFGSPLSKSPSGRGVGVACTNYLGTCVAAIAEVKVDKNTGKIEVTRVICAQDMGEIINPLGARLQIEGCITMGLGYVLTEEIRFKGGHVLDENFDTYHIPRFSWLPEIEVILIDNPRLPPQGCGEPAVTVMGALIANAVNDATGVRFYELPMSAERVRRALRGA